MLISIRLLALAVLLQSFEIIALRKHLSSSSAWSFQNTERFFQGLPWVLRSVIKFLFIPNIFFTMLALQVGVGIILLVLPPTPILLWLIIGTTYFGSLRWLGQFNGGSDAMTFLTACSLAIAISFPQRETLAFAYLGVQCCLSFVLAGIYKIKQPGWRSGSVLAQVLLQSSYDVPCFVQNLARRPFIMRIASWTILTFECLFFVALFSPRLSLVFIALAALFQLANFVVFGLNRFFFAWLASYPALYFCSVLLQK